MQFADSSSLVMNPASPYHDLLKPARYKVYYGGRGAGKDWSFAEAIVRRMVREPIRVLCTRELQNSVRDSVHRVLADTIDRLGVQRQFHITQSAIRSNVGAETIYRGLRNNATEIKSMEGIDIAWVAEGQNTSAESLRLLRPTIRKRGSQIWLSFNVSDLQAPIYTQFVANRYPDSIVHKVNFTENPFLSEELRQEMEHDKLTDYEAYEHVWLGMPRKISDAVIFGKRYRVEAFDEGLWKQAERLFFGADFGFANDPNTLMRSFILNERLYIEYEAYGVGVELDDMEAFWAGGRGATGREYPGVPGATEWPIKCDNARPETISHMRRKGFNAVAAEKWKGCVEDGIAHIKGFKEIVIHERCKHMAMEARLYSFKQDRVTGEVLPEIVDKHNHCWDGVRYSLDGHIQRSGDLGIWAKLGRQR